VTRLVWVQGTQLTLDSSALASADRATDRVLLVESLPHVARGRLHRHKAAFVLTAMRRFAEELRGDGWEVDAVPLAADVTFDDALRDAVRRHAATEVVAMEPTGWTSRQRLVALDLGVPVELTPDTMFLCGRDAFAAWAEGRKRLRMQEFYAWMRRRHGVLVDAAGEPEGGRWSFDPENRETFAASGAARTSGCRRRALRPGTGSPTSPPDGCPGSAPSRTSPTPTTRGCGTRRSRRC
jgi:deoxyribodipyrimidine photolyase-related protein